MIKLFLMMLFHSALVFAVPVENNKVMKAPKSQGYSESGLREMRSKHHLFYFGLDAYSRALNKTTSSDTAKKDLFSPFHYPFSFSYAQKLSGGQARFWTQIGYTIFPKHGSDGGTEESHFFFKLPYSKKFSGSNFEWKAGFAFHQTRIAGNGRSVELNNGGGTAVFGLPNETRTMSTLAPEFGINYEVNRTLLNGSVMIEAPFNYKRRTVSLLFGISYNFGGI